MSFKFEAVPDQDNETMVSVVINGTIVGTAWLDSSRVYDRAGRPTPRFNKRWFARLDGSDDIIGKGEARATSRKGDGFFDRHSAVEALLQVRDQARSER